MKKTIIILLFMSFGVFSQNKENIILISTNNIKETKNSKIFKINGENFRFNKGKFSKKEISIDNLEYTILSIKELKNRTKIKHNKIKDKFISMYYDKYYNIFILEKKCNNYGILYQVEWILKVDTVEID